MEAKRRPNWPWDTSQLKLASDFQHHDFVLLKVMHAYLRDRANRHNTVHSSIYQLLDNFVCDLFLTTSVGYELIDIGKSMVHLVSDFWGSTE
jgi:hypothetical protein